MTINKNDKRVENVLVSSYQADTLFSDVYIEHNSFPEMDFNSIDTSVDFFGRKLPFPLIINAITGGSEQSVEINEILYYISEDLGIPMEVGNQEAIFEDDSTVELFLGEHDGGDRNNIVIANLHASASCEDVNRAVDSIKADGIALYINAAQQIVGDDGRRDFTGILDNIRNIASTCGHNLIVKEIGSGMTKDTVTKLVDAGVGMIDISGAGGSNLIEIENLRNIEMDYSDLYDWGVPTAKSIINAREASKDVKLIASGGIKTAMDVIKALILGADYVGIGGELLKYILHGGHDYAKSYLEELMHKVRVIMLLLGAKNIEDLRKVPYKLTGKLKDIV